MSDMPSRSNSAAAPLKEERSGFSRHHLMASFGATALPARGFDVEAFDRPARETMCATPVSPQAQAQAGGLLGLDATW